MVFYRYQPVDPIDVVGKVSCPIFFIHEEDDGLVSAEENIELTNASANPTNTLWQVEDTAHARAYQTHPAEYVARIDTFFRAALFCLAQPLELFLLRGDYPAHPYVD